LRRKRGASVSTQTITANTREGKIAIDAVAIDNTPFAYHLTLWKDPTVQSQCYSITHVPTGLQLPQLFDSPEYCHRFVAALMRYELRWERPDYTDDMKRLCKRTWEATRYE
jgi:hypothetical protein